MRQGTAGIDNVLRKLERRSEPPKEKALKPISASQIPDLLANKDALREIKSVRDAVRSLCREARALDAEAELGEKSCETDIRRFCLLVCGRIIGGQKRPLSELDRGCLEQVLGFKIAAADFSDISVELQSRSSPELDAILPELLRRKPSAEGRSYDPCNSLIRDIETVAKSTGQVYGDKHGKRAAMSERIGLQLRWLVDKARDEAAEHPKAQNADTTQSSVVPVNENQNTETLDDVKTAWRCLRKSSHCEPNALSGGPQQFPPPDCVSVSHQLRNCWGGSRESRTNEGAGRRVFAQSCARQ